MPALKPSTTGMRPMTVFAARCVWPAITRSTVVFCSLSTIPMIGPSHGAAGRPSIALAPAVAPSWMTTTCTRTPWRAELRRLALGSARPRRGTSRPAVLPGLTSSGVLRTTEPMTPTRTPLTRKTVGRSPSSRARGRSPSRRCWSPGTGSSPAPGAAGSARSRSRTRGCRSSWRRAPTRSPRRSPGCPAAAPSSAARRRRCRRPPAAAYWPGRASASSSNIVASCAAPPTLTW